GEEAAQRILGNPQLDRGCGGGGGSQARLDLICAGLSLSRADGRGAVLCALALNANGGAGEAPGAKVGPGRGPFTPLAREGRMTVTIGRRELLAGPLGRRKARSAVPDRAGSQATGSVKKAPLLLAGPRR